MYVKEKSIILPWTIWYNNYEQNLLPLPFHPIFVFGHCCCNESGVGNTRIFFIRFLHFFYFFIFLFFYISYVFYILKKKDDASVQSVDDIPVKELEAPMSLRLDTPGNYLTINFYSWTFFQYINPRFWFAVKMFNVLQIPIPLKQPIRFLEILIIRQDKIDPRRFFKDRKPQIGLLESILCIDLGTV